MIELSIIIVNHNSNDYLKKCLESVYKGAKDIDLEVIVVDNASTDNSIKQTKDKFPQTKIIENKLNKGFAVANNQGITMSKGEYILLLNHDTEIQGNALSVMLDFMKKNPRVGACGAKLLNSDGSIQHQSKRGFPTPSSIFFYATGLSRLFPKSKLFGHYLLTYLDSEKINEVDVLSGACIMVRKSVLAETGLLDEYFFLYGEDIDICYRIKQNGWKIYYVPKAEIIHYGGVGSRVMSYKNIIEFHRSMYIFYNKHYKVKYSFFITLLVYLGIGFKCGINLIFNTIRKEKFVGSKKP